VSRSTSSLCLCCVVLVVSGAAADSAAASPPTFEELVAHEALEVARGRVDPPDRFEPLAARFGGADPVDHSRVRLELAEAHGPNASGVVRVTFRMLVDGLPRGQARATVRGRVRGPAIVAASLLGRGTVVGPSDLELREADLTRLGTPPLRTAAAATGLVPLRTLGPGRVLTAELLAPAPVVRRGQLVDLKIEQRGLIVRTLGRALRDGAPGEIVPVENVGSGTRLEAAVQPDGSLLVVRPSVAGRS
jgi:flagella basal body P-ring formation protein FlgA